jgi:hypothetical protein
MLNFEYAVHQFSQSPVEMPLAQILVTLGPFAEKAFSFWPLDIGYLQYAE